MNLLHRWLCGSAHWQRTMRSEVLPWVLEDVSLGGEVLEAGPGPGASTDFLRTRAGSLTCVEIDRRLAAALSQRLAGTNVRVLCEDATRMPFADASFDAAVCLTMLHHVPSLELQDRLLAEVARVLRRGGVFAGADTTRRPGLRLIHAFDTLVLVDPGTLPARLEAAGFVNVRIDVRGYMFRFRAERA